jgi:hypothetical protein
LCREESKEGTWQERERRSSCVRTLSLSSRRMSGVLLSLRLRRKRQSHGKINA